MALRVGATFDEGFAIEAARCAAGILLDSRVPGSHGGTGVTFDWGVARRLREKVPRLVVAGGLRPENIEAAIRDVGPDAVDVSTGVESAPGKKDRAKLTALFAAVEAAQPEVVR
jgi:phosphoribosylanthranilate isomerase